VCVAWSDIDVLYQHLRCVTGQVHISSVSLLDDCGDEQNLLHLSNSRHPESSVDVTKDHCVLPSCSGH
jgi:hypothetical protein